MPAASHTHVSLSPELTALFIQAGIFGATDKVAAERASRTYHFLRMNREHPLVKPQYDEFIGLTKRWPGEWSKAAGDKAAQDKLKTEFADAWAKLPKAEYELLHHIFTKYEEKEAELSDARDKANAAEDRAKKAEESVKKVLGVEEAAHHGHDDHGHHGPEPTEKKGYGKRYLGLAIAGIFFLGMFAYWGMFDKSKTWKEDSIAIGVKLNSCLKERDAAIDKGKGSSDGFMKILSGVGVESDGSKSWNTLADEVVAVCNEEPEPPPAPDYIVERWGLSFVDSAKSRIVGLCPYDARPELRQFKSSDKEFRWLEVKCLEE